MKVIASLFAFVFVSACQNSTKSSGASHSDGYHSAQEKIFKEKSAELAKAGRIPTGFDAYRYMSQYGWHSANESTVGTTPIFGTGGSFGAYAFYQPAFEQARKMWIIDGFMLPGSDLLWVTSDGTRFDKSVIGGKILRMTQEGCWKDDGNTPCEPDFKNPDFSSMLDPHSSKEIRDATILDVFGHMFEWEGWSSDGSHSHGPEYWRGPLRLNKKAPSFQVQYRIEILPDGYVDMCACTTYTTIRSEAVRETPKPCVQGGSLAPGETCGVSIALH